MADIDALAGEYVLGTLDPAERSAVAARRLREPELDAAIADWEARLGPLMEVVAPVQPPDHLIAGIMNRIEAGEGAERGVAFLHRRLRRWRLAALGAGAIAASLAAFIAVDGLRAWRPAENYVAVLQRDVASPAFIVSVDIATRSLTVRPVAATKPANQSYELWLVNEQLPAPRSLGLVQDTDFTVETARLANVAPEVVRRSTFAVTLEPAGGSPTGQPTGPILYSGALVQATP